MFDPSSIEIGGVSLILLILGLVEFSKSFGLDGKKVIALSASMGAILFGLYRVGEFVPAPYSQVYEIVLQSIALGLAASGFYMFVNKRAPQVETVDPIVEFEPFEPPALSLKAGLAIPGKKAATSKYQQVQSMAEVYVGWFASKNPEPTPDQETAFKAELQAKLETITQALVYGGRQRLNRAEKQHITNMIEKAWAKAYPR